MKQTYNALFILAAVTIGLLFYGCSKVIFKNVDARDYYPPRLGPAEGYLYGSCSGKRIGYVSGRTGPCGIKKAMYDGDLHDWIREAAGKMGGDCVSITCGPIGTTGECVCGGEVYRKAE